jgi:hypothetical protein
MVKGDDGKRRASLFVVPTVLKKWARNSETYISARVRDKREEDRQYGRKDVSRNGIPV